MRQRILVVVAMAMVSGMAGSAVADNGPRYVQEFSAAAVPVWDPQGNSKGTVEAKSFGGRNLPVKEERNGYYLIDHPTEGPVFVPAHSVVLDRSRAAPLMPCDMVGSFASRSNSGFNAGNDCRY